MINVKDASGSTVAIEVPNANGQAAMANSAPVAIASDQSAIPVSGPVTNAELRATAVPVSGTVTATGPVTNAELRATAVPVSGTVTATGPVTNAELRATAVPVSGTVTATGPVTNAELRATAVPVSGTVTATGPVTDTERRATPVPVSGTVTATGPVTDTELRATPVPVSGTVTATGPATNAELRATALPVESPGFVSAVDTTRPADTTAYTALDVLGESPAANLVFTGVGSVAGGHVIIMDASFRQDVAHHPIGARWLPAPSLRCGTNRNSGQRRVQFNCRRPHKISWIY
jgi:hypothetical protein